LNHFTVPLVRIYRTPCVLVLSGTANPYHTIPPFAMAGKEKPRRCSAQVLSLPVPGTLARDIAETNIFLPRAVCQ
jgi:hypothetical protein